MNLLLQAYERRDERITPLTRSVEEIRNTWELL
jgi:hypothetical protein